MISVNLKLSATQLKTLQTAVEAYRKSLVARWEETSVGSTERSQLEAEFRHLEDLTKGLQ